MHNNLNQQLFEAAYDGNTELVRHLLEQGANINAIDNEDGDTALALATYEGHFDTAKLLIDSGADVHIADKNGWTALMSTAQRGPISIAKL